MLDDRRALAAIESIVDDYDVEVAVGRQGHAAISPGSAVELRGLYNRVDLSVGGGNLADESAASTPEIDIARLIEDHIADAIEVGISGQSTVAAIHNTLGLDASPAAVRCIISPAIVLASYGGDSPGHRVDAADPHISAVIDISVVYEVDIAGAVQSN